MHSKRSYFYCHHAVSALIHHLFPFRQLAFIHIHSLRRVFVARAFFHIQRGAQPNFAAHMHFLRMEAPLSRKGVSGREPSAADKYLPLRQSKR